MASTKLSGTRIDLVGLRKLVERTLGICLNIRHDEELLAKIGDASEKFGFKDPGRFMEWLTTNSLSPKQTGELASFFTIGETYFMREKKGFDFLEQIYLPGIISKRLNGDRRLRIWCAGCATGEEAYSMGITLLQTLPDIKRWNVSILATDINASFLEKAQKAEYTKWSFRNTSDDFKKQYFKTVPPNKFSVIPKIREMVNFAPFNLAADNYLGLLGDAPAFDIIFCRNVLIYFSPENIISTTNKLYDSLVPGGILVTSPVEVSNLVCDRFDTITYAGFTIYHKGTVPRENKRVPAREEPGKQNFFFPPKPVLPPPVETGVRIGASPLSPPAKVTETTPEKIPPPSSAGGQPVKEKEPESAQKSEAAVDSRNISPKTGTTDTYGELIMMAKNKADLGKLKEAEAFCEKAIEKNKLDPAAYYLLATIIQEQGNDAEAMKHVKKALYLNPDFVLAHFLHGTLSMKSGQASAGIKSFKNALSVLSKFNSDEVIPESDGLTAGRFKEIIQSITS